MGNQINVSLIFILIFCNIVNSTNLKKKLNMTIMQLNEKMI